MKNLVDRDALIFSPPDLGCSLYLTGLPGGGSKIHDRSPYGNHGTITGATWVRLPSGLWCLSFDGLDDYVTIPKITLTTAFTFLCWWKRSGVAGGTTSSGYHQIIQRLNGYSAGRNRLQVTSDGSSLYGEITVDAAQKSNSETITDIDGFNQVGLWWDGAEVKVILNGILSSGAAASGTLGSGSSVANIGQQGTDGQYYCANGNIALPKINNRALSALDVQNSFNREKHLFGVW